MSKPNKTADDVLRALLETDVIPEQDVYMPRFGVSFRVKAIDQRTINNIRAQCTRPMKNGGEQFDDERYACSLIVAGCVSPDFSTPALLEKFGPTPADVVLNRLLPGEIDKLGVKIMDLSGFSKDEEDEVEDVKN